MNESFPLFENSAHHSFFSRRCHCAARFLPPIAIFLFSRRSECVFPSQKKFKFKSKMIINVRCCMQQRVWGYPSQRGSFPLARFEFFFYFTFLFLYILLFVSLFSLRCCCCCFLLYTHFSSKISTFFLSFIRSFVSSLSLRSDHFSRMNNCSGLMLLLCLLVKICWSCPHPKQRRGDERRHI